MGRFKNALMAFMVGFGHLIIFIASFLNRKAFWNITKLDIVCGAISVLALILCLITGQLTVAVIFSILADLIGLYAVLSIYYQEQHAPTYTVGRCGGC